MNEAEKIKEQLGPKLNKIRPLLQYFQMVSDKKGKQPDINIFAIFNQFEILYEKIIKENTIM